jgi:hypothetical protein
LDFGLWGPKQIGLLLGRGLWGPKQIGLLLGLGLWGPRPVGIWFGALGCLARAWGFAGGYRRFSAGLQLVGMCAELPFLWQLRGVS